MRDGDETDAAHFIAGFLPPGHSHGRTGWIARIFGRVVPVYFNVEPSALRERHKVSEKIPVLPGKVPVLNVKQGLNVSGWERGRHFELLANIMRMRTQPQGVGRNWQGIGVV